MMLSSKDLSRLKRSLVEDPETGCHVWTGHCQENGYGQIRIGDRAVGTHRVAWAAANGSIPEGLYVLHKCDNPPCCNPEHLWVGTQADNLRDMREKGRGTAGRHGLPKGVYAVPGSRYMAQLNRRGKSVYLGRFGTPEEAAVAVKEYERCE